MDLKNKKCLVTGGTGLIGRQVVELLKKEEAVVTVVSLDDIELDDVKCLQADLCYFENARAVTMNQDIVFHLAGIKGSVVVTKEKPASFFVPLLQFNTNVLEACRLNKVEKVVYTSSIGAYQPYDIFYEKDAYTGEPMDLYPGWAKRMAEFQIQTYAIQYGLDNFAIVRPCNVYGPGDNFDIENAMVIPTLMAKIDRGDNPVVVWGDGSAIRDISFSRDVAEGILLAAIKDTGMLPINLGSGTSYSIKEVIETLNSFLDFNYVFDSDKPGGYPIRVMSIEKAKKILGYNPQTSLLDGLKETWNWYQENKDINSQRHNYFKE